MAEADDSGFASRRERLVESWVRAHAVRSPRILEALRKVPREAFVAHRFSEQAYHDVPLPIGYGQTISQPLMVARMIEALELAGDERVLEVGTGSGYAAAVLSLLAREVHSVERIPELAESAAARLRKLGYANVHVHHGDGTRGWHAASPYDAIVVAAASAVVPAELLEQLSVGGRLVVPVGDPEEQSLVRMRWTSKGLEREDLELVRFVPLVAGEIGGSSPPSGALG